MRVEAIVMRRRLRWLGYIERMEDSVSWLPKCFLVCRPVSGRRSDGGQKRRWCDVLTSDLKWCDLWEVAVDLNDFKGNTGKGEEG